eukprot:9727961-Heterocapsa_arctica.AAC.1
MSPLIALPAMKSWSNCTFLWSWPICCSVGSLVGFCCSCNSFLRAMRLVNRMRSSVFTHIRIEPPGPFVSLGGQSLCGSSTCVFHKAHWWAACDSVSLPPSNVSAND